MSDQRGGATTPVAAVARRAGRFSREFLATVIALVTTAFGVVVALAWNSALTTFFQLYLSRGGQVAALFTYAVVVTAVGVVVIIGLGRVATRLNAEPIEFKYPSKGKDER